MNNKIIKPKYGFTLIELLVVISIIALLSSIISVSFGQSKAQAQDAARLETVHSIKTALEIYHVSSGSYPLGNMVDLASLVNTDLSKYMPNLPTNFTVSGKSNYYVSNGSSYEIFVPLQSNSSNSNTAGSGCNSTDVTTYLSSIGNGNCQGVNVSAPMLTINNGPGTPSVTLSLTPSGILGQGDNATLHWSSTNANSCQITSDGTDIFGGAIGGNMGTTRDYSQTVSTLSHGGGAKSGSITVACYTGNLSGTSGSATISVTVAP